MTDTAALIPKGFRRSRRTRPSGEGGAHRPSTKGHVCGPLGSVYKGKHNGPPGASSQPHPLYGSTLLEAQIAIMVEACGSDTFQLSMVNDSRLMPSVALIIFD
jgi:hypothetical protein